MSGRSAVRSSSKLLRCLASGLVLCAVSLSSATARSEDDPGPRPLRTISLLELDQLLPSGTHLLVHRGAIESFLAALEGTPPDWATVYGRGHHDPDHDERLFNLNRVYVDGRSLALRFRDQVVCNRGRPGVYSNKLGCGSIQA